MSLPTAWDGFPANEDDEMFGECMVAILEQAYASKGVDDPQDALLARIATELGIIREILTRMEEADEDRPWEGV